MAGENYFERPSIALKLLRANLGFFGSALDPDVEFYLNSLLISAEKDLARCGIVLQPGDINDAQLQAMYAAWLYRNRVGGGAKPPMLQSEIRDRQVENALTVIEEDSV